VARKAVAAPAKECTVADASIWFSIVKVIHLGALVFWLGPSGGAWMVLMLARHKAGEPSLVTHYLYRGFFQMLWLEHLGFFTMLASGLVLLGMYGFGAIATTWLELKLALVVLIIVPIELADLWFSHRGLPEIFASRRPDAPYTEREKRLLDLYHRRFVPITLPVLLATVVVVMWLAVAKPS
jgi:hypothetical protein